MTEGNSYSNLLLMMKQQGYNKDTKVVIGKVISPIPLVIDMGKYTIEEDDMFITETIDNLISGSIGDTLTNVYTTKLLKAGDKVLILVDNSDFYIIDRVV